MNGWKEDITRFVEQTYKVEAMFHLVFWIAAFCALIGYALYLAWH